MHVYTYMHMQQNLDKQNVLGLQLQFLPDIKNIIFHLQQIQGMLRNLKFCLAKA